MSCTGMLQPGELTQLFSPALRLRSGMCSKGSANDLTGEYPSIWTVGLSHLLMFAATAALPHVSRAVLIRMGCTVSLLKHRLCKVSCTVVIFLLLWQGRDLGLCLLLQCSGYTQQLPFQFAEWVLENLGGASSQMFLWQQCSPVGSIFLSKRRTDYFSDQMKPPVRLTGLHLVPRQPFTTFRAQRSLWSTIEFHC